MSIRLYSPGAVDSLPVTHGRLLDFVDDTLACLQSLHQTHGPIAALEENGQRIHFVFGPEYNRMVLSDSQRFHSRFFALRGPRKSAQRDLTSGLLSMNGDQHKEHRRLLMEAFTKRAIANYVPAVRHEIEAMVDSIGDGGLRDVNQDMTEFMLRVTSSLLFGLDEPETAYDLGRKIDHWVRLNHAAGMTAYIDSPELANRYQELLDYAELFRQDIDALITRKRSRPDSSRDALSLLMHGHDDLGRMTDGEMVGHVALMFGAAHLTTAHTLTWTLFLLGSHPDVMSQVHDELTAANAPDGAGPVMQRVIKESMRCLPASSYSQRVTSEPVELGPFSLGRGAGVVFSQFITHHLPELFPQPHEFRPERWETISPSPYAYLPFGAGPRLCIGSGMAMEILGMALPTLLRKYKFTLAPHTEISAQIVSTMLSPVSTVPMVISPQDGRFGSCPVSGNIGQIVHLPQPREIRRAA